MIPAKKADRRAFFLSKSAKKQTLTPFFSRKFVRYSTVGLAMAAILLIIIQLVYPYNKGLLFSSVGDIAVRFKSPTDIAKVIQEQFDKTHIKLAIGSDKTIEVPVKLAGAEPNTDQMVKQLTEYPLWMRIIPGSLFLSSKLEIANVYYTQTQLKTFSDTNSKVLTFAPQNARLEIKNGALYATEAVSGSKVESSELLKAIANASLGLGKTTVIQVPTKRTAPATTAKDLAKVRSQAEAALVHTVVIRVDKKQFSPKKSELADWIVLTATTEDKVILSIEKAKIKQYLETINKEVGVPAGQTDIEIVDGREVGRTTGATGKAINRDKLADEIAAALLVPPPTITQTAEFIDVQPSVIFNSKYTTTQAGLQAYVNDVSRTKNMWIQIEQLDGEKWQASARATESIPSGSTYKLYVALVLFDKMEKGEIHWDDPMLDTTVAGCFERMTVASTNPCAEKWIADFGRQYINDFVHARGFSAGTSFTTGSANQTTAADLTKYMKGLYDGTLVGGQYRDRLLDSLGRHPYRYGIPTGSQGVVHDKVGFLWDYVHDTAIIQHSRGTYLMTVMTKGQSYAAIAAVTRQVERIMYP